MSDKIEGLSRRIDAMFEDAVAKIVVLENKDIEYPGATIITNRAKSLLLAAIYHHLNMDIEHIAANTEEAVRRAMDLFDMKADEYMDKYHIER